MKESVELLHTAYAKALFEYGIEREMLDGLMKDIECAQEIFRHKMLLKALHNPMILLDGKLEILYMLKKSLNLSEDFTDFLKLLIERKKIDILHGIFLKFKDIYDAYRKRTKVILSVYQDLDKKKKQKIEHILGNILEKEIIINEKVDRNLLGGIKLQFENRVYDGSIRKKLEKIKEILV